jgi:putative oxidoreductase
MDRTNEPKLIFPGLAGFYAAVSDLWYPMIRFAIGAILFMHGYAKMANLGIAKVAGNFGTNYGLPMPTFLAYSAVFLERSVPSASPSVSSRGSSRQLSPSSC